MVREIGTLEFRDIVQQDSGTFTGWWLWHKGILVRHSLFLEGMDIDTHADDGESLAIELHLPRLPWSATESTALPHSDWSTSYEFSGGCAIDFGLLVGR